MHHNDGMTTESYETLSVPGGRPIKLWTHGVPVDPKAKLQLANTAKETKPLVTALLEQMARHNPELGGSQDLARYVVLLVVSSAIGLGVASPWLKRVKLLTGRDEIGDFARWFAEFLLVHRERLLQPPRRPQQREGVEIGDD